MVANFPNSASILFLQSICSSWNKGLTHDPVDETTVVTGHNLPAKPSDFNNNRLIGTTRTDVITYENTCDIPIGHPQIPNECKLLRCRWDDAVYDALHQCASDAYKRPGVRDDYEQWKKYSHTHGVPIDEGNMKTSKMFTFDFAKMLLHFHVSLPIAGIIAVLLYVASSLCGFYRFIETLKDYIHGCRCRVCQRDFRLIKTLNRGPSSRIDLALFLGKDQSSDLEVALKIIPIKELTEISTIQQECRRLSRLNHKYVIRYYDDFLHCEWGWNLFLAPRIYCVIVTEYCQKGSLADLIEDEYDTLTEEYTLGIFKKLVMAVKYLHEHSLIHRDIKSPNILVASKNDVRLADFGLCDTCILKTSRKKMIKMRLLEVDAHIDKGDYIEHWSEDDEEEYDEEEDEDLEYTSDTPVDRLKRKEEENNRRFANKIKRLYREFNVGPRVSRCFNRRTMTENDILPETRIINRTWREWRTCFPRHPIIFTKLKKWFKYYDALYKNTNNKYVQNCNAYVPPQIGTRCYAAPEILHNVGYSRSSDIWALGCVLLELCSGVFMWELSYNLGEQPEQVVTLVSNLPTQVSEGTKHLILQMLSVCPNTRPNAAQILRSIRKIEETQKANSLG
ncbi:hypothetical protein BaOVIS_010140 [Babesia ovis]|uniref:Protein kinase domain-containing protein n=1 Tax=Babesia ovis TaxID=5869 RepID=A0A9W5WU52_BABOV|nr:hypothetical protein BaOVIS_010140 [Babesia ovis]